MVVSEAVEIELVLTNDHEGALILDGRTVIDLERNDVIKIKRGVHTFQLVTFGTTNFYDAFREKFNFQIRPDVVPTRRPEIQAVNDLARNDNRRTMSG